MLGAINFFSRHALNFLVSLTLLTVLTASFDMVFIGLILFFVGYYVSNKVVHAFQKRKRSRALGLQFAEYKQIEAQLRQARASVTKLNSNYIRVRSAKSFKSIYETGKVAKRIINIVNTNPQKFYTVEDFFYSHLPSAVELSNNYALLTREQVKGTDIHLALEDTRKTLKELHTTIEDDLKLALQSDIDRLKIELDFAKLANEKRRSQMGGGDFD